MFVLEFETRIIDLEIEFVGGDGILALKLGIFLTKDVDLEGWHLSDAPSCKPIFVLEDVDLVEHYFSFFSFLTLVLEHHLLETGCDLLAVAAFVVLEVKNKRPASSFFKEFIQGR